MSEQQFNYYFLNQKQDILVITRTNQEAMSVEADENP